MDKIFKNNTIMGIVAIVTLALTAYLFWQVRKAQKPVETAKEIIIEPTTEE